VSFSQHWYNFQVHFQSSVLIREEKKELFGLAG
jgi:hypothetical protein